MALRYLAGKLRVSAGAALRRAEGSRGVASRSSSQKVPFATEEVKRLLDENAVLMCQLLQALREAPSYKQNYSTQLALSLSGGSILGVFIGSLMLRYDHRSGGKIGKMMRGIPT